MQKCKSPLKVPYRNNLRRHERQENRIQIILLLQKDSISKFGQNVEEDHPKGHQDFIPVYLVVIWWNFSHRHSGFASKPRKPFACLICLNPKGIIGSQAQGQHGVRITSTVKMISLNGDSNSNHKREIRQRKKPISYIFI